MENALKQTHGRGSIQLAHIRLGLVEPLNVVRRHLAFFFRSGGEIFRFATEFSEHIAHRNSLAASLCEPLSPLVEALPIFFRYRLLIGRSGGKSAKNRVKQHEFKKPNRCS
jgi:hypothetical protein